MRKKHAYVFIHEKTGMGTRYLGNRVHPGLSAATGWLQKHYSEKSQDLEANFELQAVNHETLTRIFVSELEQRMPDSPDKDLLISMLASLVQGRSVIRLPIQDKAELQRRRKQSKDDRAKNAKSAKSAKSVHNEPQCSRYEASKAFQGATR